MQLHLHPSGQMQMWLPSLQSDSMARWFAIQPAGIEKHEQEARAQGLWASIAGKKDELTAKQQELTKLQEANRRTGWGQDAGQSCWLLRALRACRGSRAGTAKNAFGTIHKGSWLQSTGY